MTDSHIFPSSDHFCKTHHVRFLLGILIIQAFYHTFVSIQKKNQLTYILNIETATKNCSVALAKDGVTIAVKEMSEQGYSHAEYLHVYIEAVLQEAGLTFKDLAAVAVSQGPGSYTGLRIGISAAKGLCFSLDIPLLAVDTLAVLALQASVNDGLIVPMIDARRMEVFSAVYDKNYIQIRATLAEIIDENSYQEIAETIHLVGDGAEKFDTILTATKFVYHADVIFPSANEMCELSFDKFQKEDFVDVAYFEPYYLKDFFLAK